MNNTENKVYPANALVLDEGDDFAWVIEPGDNEGELTYYYDTPDRDISRPKGVLKTDVDLMQFIGEVGRSCKRRREELPDLNPIVQLPESVFGPVACEMIRAAAAGSTVYKDSNGEYWVVKVTEHDSVGGVFRNELKFPSKYEGKRIALNCGLVFSDESSVDVRNSISRLFGPLTEMTGRQYRRYHFVPGSDEARVDSCYGPRLVVGDRVIFAPSIDDLEYVSKDDIPFVAGTELVYVGRGKSLRYYGSWKRFMLKGQKPGLFEQDAEYLFSIPTSDDGGFDGPSVRIAPSWLVPVDPHADKGRENAPDVMVRVGDLPELKFEVGDVVRLNAAGASKYPAEPGVYFEVERYHLEHNVTLETAGQSAHVGGCCVGAYRIIDGKKTSCYSTVFNESELELVKRGNYYRWLQDPSRMEFLDLKEEADFYTWLGESEQIRNPATGDYAAFTQEEAMAAIQRGDGCAVTPARALFGGKTPEGVWLHVYRFPNYPELEARLRAATLEGFEIKQ